MARTARQRAASRRNLVKARARRHRKALIVGAAVMGTATGVYAVDRSRNVRLYHATSHSAAHNIAKHGFRPGGVDVAGNVFFSKRRPNKFQRVNYGPATVRVKMKRSAAKGKLHRDVNHNRKKFYEIHHSHVNNKNISGIKVSTKRRRR